MDMKADNTLIRKEYGDYIAQDKVIRLRFRVRDAATGHLLQYGDDLVYLHGGYGGAFPKVERALEGCRVGDHRKVDLSAEEGYGRHDPDLILVLPPDEFAEQIPETGSAVEGELPDGRSMVFTVAEVSRGRIILDGNHPFAGKQLVFNFEVAEIRDSTEYERSAGFAFDGMFC